MKKGLFKKGMVLAIIGLFFGAGIVPNICTGKLNDEQLFLMEYNDSLECPTKNKISNKLLVSQKKGELDNFIDKESNNRDFIFFFIAGIVHSYSEQDTYYTLSVTGLIILYCSFYTPRFMIVPLITNYMEISKQIFLGILNEHLIFGFGLDFAYLPSLCG